MKTNFQLNIRQSLNTIFNHTTEQMSQQEESVSGTIVCLLPEMVSSLRKDIYFFAPEVSYFQVHSVVISNSALGTYSQAQIRRIDASTKF